MGYHWSVISGAKSVVAAISGFSAATVKLQKRPYFSADHGHTLPFVSVVPGAEKVVRLATNNLLHVEYSAYVVILQRKGATVEDETQLQWQLDRREDVRQALWKTSLSGATTVIDCDYDPAPAFDLGGLDKQHDVSVQRFGFISTQSRAV